jgi:hypothetical protein
MPLMYLSSGTTAVQDDKKIFQRLRAYPNPASEEVYFPIGNPQGGPFQLFIYNQQGLLVYNEPLQSNDLERINLSGWASGIYEAVVIGKKGKVLGGRFCISARE